MNRIRKSKTLMVLSVLIVGVFLLLVTRITYAFLAPLISEGKSVDISGKADLVDDFKLDVGDALVINATPTTLPENGNNYVSSTKATAKLKANSTNNSVTKNYYLYLELADNTFEHVNEGNPEILLSITNPSGEAITSLGNLTYGTYNGVAGFDVTEVSGVFTIASNYEISSTSSSEYTTQEWIVKLTYLNHNFDQSSNFGKSLKTTIYFQKEEMSITLAEWVKEQYASQTSGSETIFLHNSNLENGAGDNSYRYSGANPNNYVCFGSDAETCPDDNLYRIIGVFDDQVKLIKWDYATSTLLGTNGGFAGAYSEAGWNGTNNGTNLTTSIGIYFWNSTASNTWSSSTLNTVNLNLNFTNNIDETWAKKIASTIWKVGGTTNTNVVSSPAAKAYTNEYINPEENTIETKKIGLMYASDYGFAAAPSAWTSNLSYYNGSDITSVNWMYMGLVEWTLVRRSGTRMYAFVIEYDGSVNYEDVGSRAYGVRPVFYLESSVNYGSGLGSKANPVRLK